MNEAWLHESFWQGATQTQSWNMILHVHSSVETIFSLRQNQRSGNKLWKSPPGISNTSCRWQYSWLGFIHFVICINDLRARCSWPNRLDFLVCWWHKIVKKKCFTKQNICCSMLTTVYTGQIHGFKISFLKICGRVTEDRDLRISVGKSCAKVD